MASPDYDVFVVDKSNQTNETPFIFKDKQYVAINDSNQGVYSSGQVQFDLTQISSSSLYLDAKSSYLEIPFTIQVEAEGDLENFDNKELPVVMKNGAHNLIHSMEAYLSGQQVIATQSFSNIPITYKVLTTTSPSDLKTTSPSMLISDETDAIHAYDSVIGHVTSDSYGLTARQRGVVNPANAFHSDFIDANALSSVRQPYAKADGSKIFNINMIATLPLAHLHDFFQQLPLIKGSYLRLVFNLNIPCSARWADSSKIVETNPTVVSTTQVLPFQLNLTREASAGSPLAKPITAGQVNNANKSLTISSKVGNAFKSTGCAIHCAMCEFTPMYASEYLKNAVKTIKYVDFLSYNNLTNVTPDQFVQHQVTSGLARLRHMLIVPQLSRASTAGSLLPITSPFCSAPSCTAPFSVLSNFNVSVSGRNLYQSNIQYSWEHWLEQISYMGGIDGNPKSELGLKSGLISEDDWKQAYRYIYVNLANKNEAEDEVPRSVTVSFTNRCKLPLDFYIFLFYEKEVSVDCATGQLII